MAQKTLTDEQKRSRAYNRAVRRMREEYPEAWQHALSTEYKAEGLDYKPRLTPEQKAKKQIDDLLAQFPELAGEYGAMPLS